MRYAEFLERQQFDKQELIACGHGCLVEDPPEGGVAPLPAPPFLMFDRITELNRGERRGQVVAEQDIDVGAWYFQCHFRGDPVQPGCLGLDALWQLLGFYVSASGTPGSGRALGVGALEFSGQIRPYNKVVRYELDVLRLSRFVERGAAMAIARGRVLVDGELIYTAEQLKAGIFRNIAYKDYPNPDSPQAKGGLLSE